MKVLKQSIAGAIQEVLKTLRVPKCVREGKVKKIKNGKQ